MASGRNGIVPYFRGAVVVVKYDYLEGTHVAWKASQFAAIAETIKVMHSQNIVHADVRGFNMLHPIKDSSICISCSNLLDFDLNGMHGTDVYPPPGFVDALEGVAFIRPGKPSSKLQMCDDWYELADCMTLYDVVGDESVREAWLEFFYMFAVLDGQPFPGGDGDIFAAKLDAFISNHGDCRLKLLSVLVLNWRRIFKGTGAQTRRRSDELVSELSLIASTPSQHQQNDGTYGYMDRRRRQVADGCGRKARCQELGRNCHAGSGSNKKQVQ